LSFILGVCRRNSSMSTVIPTPERPAARWWLLLSLPVLLGLALFAGAYLKQAPADAAQDRLKAPELDGGVAWLNTAQPLKLKDLKGKIVLIDFWTLCCINCIHIMPDLEELEKKYPKELVVIGCHTAKFENEKDTDSIRKAILRYEIKHPVVNDANQKIWDSYGVSSWPTLVLIDPEGNAFRAYTGEGNYDAIDKDVAALVKKHRDNKTLDEKPISFELVRERAPSPLFFPGKVLADEKSKRLFIADSTNHRIVVTDLDGKKIAIAGTGQSGTADGDFAKATFNDPQGMALKGDTLYVADRKNHTIRALDLKKETVKTIAGTGKQADERALSGDALTTGLNSPWDLLLVGDDKLYIAMAGSAAWRGRRESTNSTKTETSSTSPWQATIKSGSSTSPGAKSPDSPATAERTSWTAPIPALNSPSPAASPPTARTSTSPTARSAPSARSRSTPRAALPPLSARASSTSATSTAPTKTCDSSTPWGFTITMASSMWPIPTTAN